MEKLYHRLLLQIVFSFTLCQASQFNLSAQTFELDTILYHGDPSKFINFVVLGDGFQASEFSLYSTNVQALTTFLFNQSPYQEYENYFNVFSIKVPSIESGSDHPHSAPDCPSLLEHPILFTDTYFDGIFDCNSIHRLLVPNDYNAIITVLYYNFPQYDKIIMLENSPYYGGSGGSLVATGSLVSSSFEIIMHELGHSFAGLRDEYWAGDQFAGEYPNMTQQTNPELVKWKNWLGYGDVGIYQHCCGGNSANWYRPHNNCKMRLLGPSHPFCPVCKETIIEKIHEVFGSPVIAYQPSTEPINYCAPPILFKLTTIKPIPNTLRVKWILNGTTIVTNIDSIYINVEQLDTGVNILLAEVIDTTSLTRSDLHFQTNIHTDTVGWTITYPPVTPTITPSGATTFCEGNSVILTASQASSYLWSNSETTQSITVLTSGDYSVTITDGNGCSATSLPTVVEVNPLPIVTITPSGPTTFCEGNSVMLTASQASSYLWSNGETTQSITVLTSGDYSVTVIDGNGCSAASLPYVILVNPLPAVTITPSGATTFCEGNSVTLTASQASSYLWSNGETTQSITVLTSGDHSVTITDGNGCSATSLPTVVVVNPLPIVTITPNGATTFCEGNSVTLTASQASSYLWSNGETTQSITVLTSGDYSVTVTDGNGCSVASLPTVVVVNPLPPTPTITANDTVLTSSSQTGNQWYLNGNIISGATSQTYTVTQNGYYTVVVTDSNGCSNTSEPYNYTTVGMAELPKNIDISIIPNPNDGQFRIKINSYNYKEIRILNSLGIVIYQSKIGETEINLSQQQKGLYFIEIKMQEKVYYKKFIMQ
jgi:hypothetical protein